MTTGAPFPSDAQLFPGDHLPPLSLTRVRPEQVAWMYEHFRDPLPPASFDYRKP